jgi:hypothetical protein
VPRDERRESDDPSDTDEEDRILLVFVIYDVILENRILEVELEL